ncbi:Transmembrane_domain-containing protein [Hexamita inflata]|uniref:Transmembrane domain-containing protein n=1 Tax=Hexamita inflata TaxID=28002 RepID=A0AA86NBV2_9EUKA|nr:Transmembrane domain-containing protein [Hexamita inflata]
MPPTILTYSQAKEPVQVEIYELTTREIFIECKAPSLYTCQTTCGFFTAFCCGCGLWASVCCGCYNGREYSGVRRRRSGAMEVLCAGILMNITGLFGYGWTAACIVGRKMMI